VEESLSILKKDPRFAVLIKKYGPPTLTREAGYFQALVRSIIYQQVTGKAAASIMAKFVALFPKTVFPTPAQVNKKTVEELRTAGLSGQKASYIKDLALKFTDGTIREKDLDSMTTVEITEHLVQVKGIGVWTVHMFLIFTLGRLDVLPVGDLGVRKGMQVVFKMRALPNPKQMEQKAKPWRQHASVVSWYLWRVADEAKLPKTKVSKIIKKKHT
jgi:DNA-3-methyladenine glycosylase II